MNGTDSSKVTVGMGSETTGNCYYDHLPVWASGNLYFNGARAWEKETDAVTDTEHTVDISVEEKEDGWYLKTNLYDIIKEENERYHHQLKHLVWHSNRSRNTKILTEARLSLIRISLEITEMSKLSQDHLRIKKASEQKLF